MITSRKTRSTPFVDEIALVVFSSPAQVDILLKNSPIRAFTCAIRVRNGLTGGRLNLHE
jgi:hypothetical protein